MNKKATLNFSSDRMYTYIRGFADAMAWENVQAALPYARDKHSIQVRKDGQPYIVHPLTMACHALSLGVRDEAVIAGCLLHDIVEDCGVEARDLPISANIKDIVTALTHIKGESLEDYYAGIRGNPRAAFVKIFDRCHNASSMSGTFSLAKTADYIDETDIHVMPLFPVVKTAFPSCSDALFVLKYHILSMDNSLKYMLESINAEKGDAGPCPT